MAADGTNQMQLTDTSSTGTSTASYAFGDYDPKISPDGAQIVFARHLNDTGNFGTGDYDIYIMNINGSNLTDISNNGDADLMPTWNPNGDKIAFRVIGENLTDLGDIFVVNPDGTGRTKVTREPDSMIERQPDWLSGAKIVFTGEPY